MLPHLITDPLPLHFVHGFIAYASYVWHRCWDIAGKKKKTCATSNSEHFIIHEEAQYRLHTRAEEGLKALEEWKAVVGASFAHLLG